MFETPETAAPDQPRRRGFPREATLRGSRRGSAKAAIFRREDARHADGRHVWPTGERLDILIIQLRIQGLTLRAIASELMRRDIWTRGCSKRWTATQVRRILQRAREHAPERIALLEAEVHALRWLLDSEGASQRVAANAAARKGRGISPPLDARRRDELTARGIPTRQ
jgi:hypothetical protein